MAAPAATLEELLARHTASASSRLIQRLEDGKVRCLACAHRCVIFPGKSGICKVRFNRAGDLRVPWGYMAAIQCDPTEKKPFFHALPGSLAMSFGMLGCDLHCPYCVSGDTWIWTHSGPRRVDRLFQKGLSAADGNGRARSPSGPLEVYTHTGSRRRVSKIYRHRYDGDLLEISIPYLPALRVTPDHPLLVRRAADREPAFRPAGNLKSGDSLLIPRRYEFSETVVLDVRKILAPLVRPIRFPHRRIHREDLERILKWTVGGISSAEIGRRMDIDASHIRHLRSRVRRGKWNLERLEEQMLEIVQEGEKVRFPKEHRPGIPGKIVLDERLAKLLGYYAAEGCVTADPSRVRSASLSFTFSKKENDKVEEVRRLIRNIFGVEGRISHSGSVQTLWVEKSSLAWLFAEVGGKGARHKKVPEAVFQAERSIVTAFLEGYIAGDGHVYPNGKIAAGTVSEELAWGLTALVLKLGMLPALRFYPTRSRPIQGRRVSSAPVWYQLEWYTDPRRRKWVCWDDDFWYLPIQRITRRRFAGPVYNLEVEENHTFLGNFVVSHNCQNWVTSQTIRDPEAGSDIYAISPERYVDLAVEYGAKVVASTYNEPLITSEWAVEVFRAAKEKGLKCAYVSNGNATAEVLDFIRPYVDLYKIDLKSFDDKDYRALGAPLDHILKGVEMVYQKGFWLEIVTLVVPGFNDSDEELKKIARFLVGLSRDIPWHVTAFHKDYKMTDPDNTPAETLLRAAAIGEAEGLRYIYAGNLPGRVGKWENTYCPNCGALLIERFGFRVKKDRVSPSGRCPECRTPIPGVWS